METLSDNTVVFTADTGNKLKVSAYGQHIIRLQSAALNQAFFNDDHYEMVESHDWKEPLLISSSTSHWQISPSNNPHLQVNIAKSI